MSSPANIRIDGIEYQYLGDNKLRNVKTNEVLDASQISEVSNIYLGSGNDMRGLSIGNRTTEIVLCPKCSPKVWSNISKVLLVISSGLLIAGSIGLGMGALSTAISITFISVGIFGILSSAAYLFITHSQNH